MQKRLRWLGKVPQVCEVGGEPLTSYFVDGALASTGQWAIMCPSCHAKQGLGFGVGRGQLYIHPTGERVIAPVSVTGV